MIVAGYPLGKNINSSIKTHKVVTSLSGAGDNFQIFKQMHLSIKVTLEPIINQYGNIVGVAVATWVEGCSGCSFWVHFNSRSFSSSNT